MGEIGSNGTDSWASLQIQTWGESPQPLLQGALGNGWHAPGKILRGELPSPSKAEIKQTKNGVALVKGCFNRGLPRIVSLANPSGCS